MNHPEEILWVVFPANDDTAKVMKPSEQALDFPTAAIAALHAAILHGPPRPSAVVGNDQLHGEALANLSTITHAFLSSLHVLFTRARVIHYYTTGAILPQGVTVWLESGLLERTFIRRESFLGVDMTLLTTVPQRRVYLLAKRATDLVASTTLPALLSFLFLPIAAAIKLSSSQGPVFYPLCWLGKNGKPFVGYKFRTMVPHADQLKQKLVTLNEMEGPVFKMRNNPRITRPLSAEIQH